MYTKEQMKADAQDTQLLDNAIVAVQDIANAFTAVAEQLRAFSFAPNFVLAHPKDFKGIRKRIQSSLMIKRLIYASSKSKTHQLRGPSHLEGLEG
jgi:hypothetical protein